MKLTDVKRIDEASAFKIGPEWNYVLEQILEGKKLTGLHYNLMAKLLHAWKCGWALDKVTIAEASPTKCEIDEVKALDPIKMKELARMLHNATRWPGVMFDFFPAYSPIGMRPVMGQGSE